MITSYEAKSQQNWEALAEVWERYQPRFYQKAFRYLGSREDAEDAVQDALLRALKGFGQFRGEAQLSTWLYTIVINCARSILRQQLRHDVLTLDERIDGEENLTWADLLVDSTPGQEEIYVGSELHQTVNELLQRLPAPQRTVFSLRAKDGLSTREIAERLGIPEGTAKAQLFRARAKLLSMLRQAKRGSLLRNTPDDCAASVNYVEPAGAQVAVR